MHAAQTDGLAVPVFVAFLVAASEGADEGILAVAIDGAAPAEHHRLPALVLARATMKRERSEPAREEYARRPTVFVEP
jgi:hypothetical protein